MSESANGQRVEFTYEQMALEVMTGTHQLLYNHNRDDDVIAWVELCLSEITIF